MLAGSHRNWIASNWAIILIRPQIFGFQLASWNWKASNVYPERATNETDEILQLKRIKDEKNRC